MILQRLLFNTKINNSDVDYIVPERSRGVSKEVIFHLYGIHDKITIEREAQHKVLVIKIYHNNSVAFNVLEFMGDMLNKYENIRFSGYCASHKNGAAERTIKTVVTMERNMLMHAQLGCHKDIIYTDIWPMEMDYDVWVYNCIPDIQSVLSAI